jgi:ABC-type maltose transport system permease subunit
VIFLVLSIMLVLANIDTAVRMRAVRKDTTRSTALFLNEIAGTVGVVVLVVIPWILGGLRPTREDLTWAILLAFGSGFISIAALVLSVFDTARIEADDRTEGET